MARQQLPRPGMALQRTACSEEPELRRGLRPSPRARYLVAPVESGVRYLAAPMESRVRYLAAPVEAQARSWMVEVAQGPAQVEAVLLRAAWLEVTLALEPLLPAQHRLARARTRQDQGQIHGQAPVQAPVQVQVQVQA